ncbi:uncharacterized protein ATNIH1004_011270 [Aspergillus tanneri]|uniref:Cryptic loci regulator 2 N-terminal domain-containing protein n=1 Tax=Aspergillus tanneri TaxID=1220188 RepID=A0A5M9M9L9_9EURO|nr:uncharacterized protein ATNIH1004_011270 [Aspergillus tanneri]KAA8642326.1 hypothetical protein ATNIH1004_011270 [Aspergillus tanneri]
MMSTPQGGPSPNEGESVIVVPINPTFSDGDRETWPKDPKYGMPDDSVYREKLAKLWLQKTGAYKPGMQYELDRLPDGYALLDRPRMSKPDIRDKFLWGHPVGQYFFSPIQFFPHFYYLMTGGTTPCPCALCEKLSSRQEGRRKPGRPVGSSSSVASPVARPAGRKTTWAATGKTSWELNRKTARETTRKATGKATGKATRKATRKATGETNRVDDALYSRQ